MWSGTPPHTHHWVSERATHTLHTPTCACSCRCWQRSEHLHTLSLHQLSLSSVLAVCLFVCCVLSLIEGFPLFPAYTLFHLKKEWLHVLSKDNSWFKKTQGEYSSLNQTLILLPLAALLPKPPPRTSPANSFRSSASSVSFPGSHAGDGGAPHRDGEGSEGEHEHLCTQRGSLGAGGEHPR